MDEPIDTSTIPQSLLKDNNVVDKAAQGASQAIDATRAATNAALDTAAVKVEAVRGSLSPALDRSLGSLVAYTRKNPINALVAAMAAGAILTMVLRPR